MELNPGAPVLQAGHNPSSNYACDKLVGCLTYHKWITIWHKCKQLHCNYPMECNLLWPFIIRDWKWKVCEQIREWKQVKGVMCPHSFVKLFKIFTVSEIIIVVYTYRNLCIYFNVNAATNMHNVWSNLQCSRSA